MTAAAQTLFDKIWQRHVVATDPGGRALLYIDRHLLHDGSFHAFAQLRDTGRSVRRPDLAFATTDHYVPTVNRPGVVRRNSTQRRCSIDICCQRSGVR